MYRPEITRCGQIPGPDIEQNVPAAASCPHGEKIGGMKLYRKDGKPFIFVGRLDEWKGIRVLFSTWELLGENAPELNVCGTGPLDGWCREYAARHRLRVNMKGFLDHEEVKRMIAGSEALVLPTQWYEGFPMVIVEAYAMGTPVLGSEFGNTGMLIEEGITGYRFDGRCPDSIIQAMKKLRESPLKRARIREIYQQKYSVEQNYRMLTDIYRKVLTERKR